MSVRRLAIPGYTLALALLITAPVLGPGYLLLRDAVSTPRSYLSDAALGLTEAAPRALPQDFFIAAASRLLDGGVVVKALLVAGLWLAGWGAARLVDTVLPDTALPGQFVAATVAVWNPYVAERLLQGHWSLLVGYGCLPWVAAAMLRLRSGAAGRSGWCALIAWIALAGLTPTGLLLAVTVAWVAVAAPGPGPSRPRSALVVLLVGAVSALPWLLAAGFTHSLSGYSAGAAGSAAFAARAEPGLGTLGSLAGLAGIWNSEAVPGSRTTLLALLGTAVLLAVVLAGAPLAARHRGAIPLLMLAAAAVLLPAAAATGPGLALLTAAADALPGLGVLRDGQKWVALAIPGYALAAAGVVVTVPRRLPRLRPAAVAALCCGAVIAALPDLAWGVGGAVRAVHYPPGWAAVAEHINADPYPVAVLPADSMRQFGWAGAAPVLDPIPRWVRAEVLSTGDLSISGATVLGEGGTAREVQDLLLAGADPARLAEAGVGWVLIESGSSGELGSAARTLEQLSPVYADADLRLYRVPGATMPEPNPHRRVLIAAHLAWLVLLVGAFAGAALAAARRRGLPRVTPDR